MLMTGMNLAIKNLKPLVLVPSQYEYEVLKEVGSVFEVFVIGVGVVEAGLSSLEIFYKFNPKFAILTGWAGAYPGSGLNVGDVVVATREVFADFGRKHKTHCSFFSDKIAGKFSCNLNHPFTEKLIYFLETGGFSPVTGTFATVCMASYHIERAKIIENRFSAIAENMEGFGVARAGEKKGIYIAEIRIISNLLKEPEKDWDFKKAGTKLKEVWKWLAKNLK